MAKMTLTPPKQSAEDFIRNANAVPEPIQTLEQTQAESYPWDDPRVREDVIKSVNLRLSEPYILKLQYLSEKTNKSQQELIREALLPYLDDEVQKY